MPHVKLTAKQEAFCQAIADGMTQADAYRAAYNAGKMSDKAIWVKASELMSDGKVSVRVAELKQALADKQLWSREMSVKGLVAAYRVANEGKNASGMTGAIKELNAMHGYNEPAKVDLNHKGIVTQIVIKGVDANDD
jgi:phage terminase small subunit